MATLERDLSMVGLTRSLCFNPSSNRLLQFIKHPNATVTNICYASLWWALAVVIGNVVWLRFISFRERYCMVTLLVVESIVGN